VNSLTAQLVATAIVVGVAACLQRLSGFGFALMTTPLLSLFLPVQRAVIILAFASVPSTLATWWELRAHTDRPQVARMVGWSVLGMPIGLVAISRLPDSTMRIVLAVVIFTLTTILATGARIPTAHQQLGDRISGFVSGILATSTGTNGPPLVINLTGQDLAPNRVRATLGAIFALSGIVSIIVFAAGRLIRVRDIVLAAASLPLLLLGRALGAKLAVGLDDKRFRMMTYSLLAATALVSALTALR
jgi:uncharacterized protein